MPNRRDRSMAAIAIVLALTMPAGAIAAESAMTILRSFDGAEGGSLYGGVIADQTGTIYGVAQDGGPRNAGTVYRLVPPAAADAKWQYELLHSFRRGWIDGFGPKGQLIRDSTGALFGATEAGGRGGAGTVFKLVPPADGGGEWTETILYSFADDEDGGAPMGPLVLDASGTIYGVASHNSGPRPKHDSNPSICNQGCGMIFRLAPPASGNGEWAETVLYRFKGEADGAGVTGGLIFDQAGDLIGATYSGGRKDAGTIYALVPPKAGGTEWSKRILYDFSGGSDGALPIERLTLGPSGSVFGVTAGGADTKGGTAFQLVAPTEPGGAWTKKILYKFDQKLEGRGPSTSLTIDSDGSLFGATMYGGPGDGGTVFRLDPPLDGAGIWRETTLQSFDFQSEKGCYPAGAVALGPSGELYAANQQGGVGRDGIVFMLAPRKP